MSDRPRMLLPLALVLSLAILTVFLWIGQQPDAEPSIATTDSHPSNENAAGPQPDEPIHPSQPEGGERPASPLELPPLSILAEPPDWQVLEIYQETITREHFEDLLTRIFTTSDAWRSMIEIRDDHARVKMHTKEGEDVFFLLRFAASEDVALPVQRFWRAGATLPPAPMELPLKDLHIAIDPGHIGGAWARMEERWFSLNGDPPVTEGDMTLKVANMLKPRLEKLGARVTLVRENSEPITPMRPEMLLDLAMDPAGDASPAAMQRLAERLFYRTAEIRARAFIVNQRIRPDLVICLHFNAEAWGDPSNPTLVDRTHFHILLNGGYTDDEIEMEDQRFALLQKLLQRTHEEEALVGATVADRFAEASGLPPYQYPVGARNVRQVNDHPFLWARNLLANRLYDCPVLFMEPYVMNSRQDYARIQAGDYAGLREINGQLLPSIYREYVDGLVDGLVQHYQIIRGVEESITAD